MEGEDAAGHRGQTQGKEKTEGTICSVRMCQFVLVEFILYVNVCICVGDVGMFVYFHTYSL